MSVVWLTGLPAVGKTTVARRLQAELKRRSVRSVLLDGDEVRQVLTPAPTYSDEERDRFYTQLGGIASLLARQVEVVIVAATAPLRRHREVARASTGSFFEILLVVAPSTLEARDPKGLYAAVKAGSIDRLPGRGAPFEDPEHPDLVFDTNHSSAEEIAGEIADVVLAPAPVIAPGSGRRAERAETSPR